MSVEDVYDSMAALDYSLRVVNVIYSRISILSSRFEEWNAKAKEVLLKIALLTIGNIFVCIYSFDMNLKRSVFIGVMFY